MFENITKKVVKKVYTYQKTLLYSLRNIDSAIASYDNLVELTALNSKYSTCGCVEVANKVLDFIDKKNKLKVIKEKIGKLVSYFTADEKLLYEKKFLGKNRDTSKYTAKQYYRNLDKLLKNFSNTLKIYDLTEQWFEENCMDLPLIKFIYTRIESGNDRQLGV